jgi:hypothetical protein
VVFKYNPITITYDEPANHQLTIDEVAQKIAKDFSIGDPRCIDLCHGGNVIHCDAQLSKLLIQDYKTVTSKTPIWICRRTHPRYPVQNSIIGLKQEANPNARYSIDIVAVLAHKLSSFFTCI